MGLDCSHDAFHGAYSAFNQLRQRVCQEIGGSYPPHEDETQDPTSWYWDSDLYSKFKNPGLYLFLTHSDCGGFLTPESCVHVANELEALVQNMDPEELGGQGHIGQQGGYVTVLRKFIAGCRAATAANETLEFY